MNQEQVAYRLKDMSKVTGEMLLKLILLAIQETEERYQQFIGNKNFTSETSWNNFLATSEEKYFKEFLSSELHSKALKDYLNEHNIGFAMQKLPNGKMEIAIDAKNIQQLENFLTKFKQEVATEVGAQALTNRLVKSSNSKTLEEKLEDAQRRIDQQVAQGKTVKDKATKKEKGQEL